MYRELRFRLCVIYIVIVICFSSFLTKDNLYYDTLKYAWVLILMLCVIEMRLMTGEREEELRIQNKSDKLQWE